MEQPRSRNTKIVATVGPKCNKYEQLRELVEAGVDVFRLNFSHGEHAEFTEIINHITRINDTGNRHVGILADLQGPKLRIGDLAGGDMPIAKGEILTLTTRKDAPGTKDGGIFMSYEYLAEDCKVGERVLMDDGNLGFVVIESNQKDTIKLECTYGGILKRRKGVNLPDSSLRVPALTESDKYNLEYLLTKPINWIALSFVRRPSDLEELRRMIDERKHQARIIAKIEKPEAIETENLKRIIQAANGIMIARGDLGVELPFEQLPTIQKEIIVQCMQFARPVIVATQMMESMITNPMPTRAEVTDVANAVLDGADAVMLSAETAMGEHPALVVRQMAKIIVRAETNYWPQIESKRPRAIMRSRLYKSDVVCFKACEVGEALKAVGIVGMTSSGYTAFKVSSFRPKAKIFIFSDREDNLRALNLLWGVKCFYYNNFQSTDTTITECTRILLEAGEVEHGDILINTASMPINKRQRTNMLRVTEVGEDDQ